MCPPEILYFSETAKWLKCTWLIAWNACFIWKLKFVDRCYNRNAKHCNADQQQSVRFWSVFSVLSAASSGWIESLLLLYIVQFTLFSTGLSCCWYLCLWSLNNASAFVMWLPRQTKQLTRLVFTWDCINHNDFELLRVTSIIRYCF